MAAALVGVVAACAVVAPASASSLRPATSCDTYEGYLAGFDASVYDGTIDWSDVTCESFVYVEATDGTSYTDPDFAADRTGAAGAGLAFGAYDFFEPNESAATQASYFLQSYSPKPGDLPPVLDVETTGGEPAATVLSGIGTWVSDIEAATGVVPAIYTGSSFWTSTLGNSSAFTADPLWFAEWDVSLPSTSSIPASDWGGNGWTFWQYSDAGTVAGDSLTGSADLDAFIGASLSSIETSTATTTSITSLTASPVVGQPVEAHVKVTGGETGTDVLTPTGTVTVSDGDGQTCEAPLSGSAGVATGSCSITEDATGAKTFSASYPGDSNWTGSDAPGTAVTVGKAATTTSLSVLESAPVSGESVGVEADVAAVAPGAGEPTGTVTVSDGDGQTCPITLSSTSDGEGTCDLTEPAGTFALSASYSGNPDFHSSSTASTTSLVVAKATSTTSLAISDKTVTYGDEQRATISVTVSPQIAGLEPSGEVRVVESSTTLCVVTLSAGKGSCTLAVTKLAAGNYRLVADYGGDDNFDTSSSPEVSLTVARATSTTKLQLAHAKVTEGDEQTERLSVSVTPDEKSEAATGTVAISIGSTTVCVVKLAAGKGSCTLTAKQLKAGTYHLVARYAGSADVAGSSSAKSTLTVAS